MTGRGALCNAREAMLTLTAAVTDRLTLTDRLAEVGQAGPGVLCSVTPEECYELLSDCVVGRLAYVARAGVPDIVPVNYVLDGRDILIRSGPGPKLQAAERRDVVAFEVDDIDVASRSGLSVVVVGRARRMSPDDRRRLDSPLDPTPWALGPRHELIRIQPTRVTGRRLS
jgi:nitroimidazol reductase NimA-like FMN-containing flavoprotein (pyridoxamine 5'-phosphate oxidase superfamily)